MKVKDMCHFVPNTQDIYLCTLAEDGSSVKQEKHTVCVHVLV